MWKTKKTDNITTLLGSDASVEGVIDFKGTIRLDGNVKGEIRSKDGTVIIGEKAVVNADIKVDIAIIMGKVNGVIKANKRIEVYPPGSIIGDIQAPIISIDAGVNFNGNCAMQTLTTSSNNIVAPNKSVSVNKDLKIEDSSKNH